MNSILEDLYFGRISPWERRRTQSAERSELSRKIENEKQHFTQTMSKDDCERFDKLESLYSQSGCLEDADAFSHGFKLGALFMYEVMDGNLAYSK